jgi:hypothetical protein
MTDNRKDAAKARAEAAFHLPATETKAAPGPLAEYRARQDAERAKMAKLRAARLEAAGKANHQ